MERVVVRLDELEEEKEEIVWLIEARIFARNEKEAELFVRALEDKGFHVETRHVIFEY
ncbi:hypothetical protein [Archaeoglobus veneficus]|uniref:Uncharacterized protein n=1 Tax=Archaeoglobus veneficus (strain DSM 11195 / SNP6) TaxID=693661 RepID=F2KRY0_ARCVS|nr:hypothetical protein [Archaeoglobus veneficus]AEA46821.1 hypothetical protein Arcve_0805 [Archaeoglobus veneficus SNP6]